MPKNYVKVNDVVTVIQLDTIVMKSIMKEHSYFHEFMQFHEISQDISLIFEKFQGEMCHNNLVKMQEPGAFLCIKKSCVLSACHH